MLKLAYLNGWLLIISSIMQKFLIGQNSIIEWAELHVSQMSYA